MSAALRRTGRVASVSRLSSLFSHPITARRSLTLASTANRTLTLPTPTARTWTPVATGAGRQPWLRCSFSAGNPKRQGLNPPLPKGWFYLDEKQLDRISTMGPEVGNYAKRMSEVSAMLKKYGAPPELKEVLDAPAPSLRQLPKVAKSLLMIAHRAAEWESRTLEQQMAERKAAGLDQEPGPEPKQEPGNEGKGADVANGGKGQKKVEKKAPEESRASTQENPSKQEATKEDATKEDAIQQEHSKTEKQDEDPKQQQQQQQQQQQAGHGDAGAKGPKKNGPKTDQGGAKGPWKWAGRISPAEIISAIVILLIVDALTRSDKEITWQEVRKNFLDKGLVRRFTVRRSKVEVVLHDDASSLAGAERGARYVFTIGSVESFEKQLEAAQDELGIPSSERIPVNYANGATILDLAIAFGPTLLLFGLLAWGTKSLGSRGPGGTNIFSMNKNQAKIYSETDIKVRFADVAGMEEAKVEIMEFVAFLKEPAKFERLGAKIPRGAILSGPPGTGKTLLAKATAGESGVPFFSVSGSEFVEMFVGVGPSRVRDLFAQARKNSPCIIFIDEIDAIGRARNSKAFGGGNDEREATLNQILTEMDGFNTTEQVVVLAGTNRADILDKALLRPGRFDRHIYVDRPTSKGREAIFRVHLKRIVTKEDLDHLVGRLANLTPGFSGADIANVVNEAALIAARADAMSVETKHFEQAIERVIGGLERKSLVLKPDERKVVSYHEAGHAICGWFLEHADPLLKVSIIPRGQAALGYAQYLPGDKYLMNEQQLTHRMAMMLGGRVSEELHFPTVTTGASDDFRKVTQTARQMVTQWGMSDKVGPIFFDHDPNQFQKPFAESTAQTIDKEVQRIINAAYEHCKQVLTEHKTELVKLAEELLLKEVLTRDDLVRILGRRKWGGDADFEKYWGGSRPAAGPPPPPSEQDPAPVAPQDHPEGPMPPAPALNRPDLQQW